MFHTYTHNFMQSAHPSLRFIWYDLMSIDGRWAAKRTVAAVLIGAIATTLAPYGLGMVVDGVTTHSWNAFWYGLAIFVLLRLFDDGLNWYRLRAREEMFQNNYWHIPQQLTRRFFDQPLGTLIGTDDMIDGGGVESIRDKAYNVLGRLSFSVIPSYALVLFGTIACTWVHPILGGLTVAYVITEMAIATHHNRIIADRMRPIAEALRIWEKRVRSWWDAVALIKSNGVEQRIDNAVRQEVQVPLADDFAIWGRWFPNAVTIRRVLDLVWSLGIYALGAYWAFVGTVSTEAFVLLFFSFQRVTMALQDVSDAQREVQRELATITSYREQLERTPDFTPRDGHAMPDTALQLTFANVSLTLHSSARSRPILRNVSTHVEAGERVGIVGPSGAGKTQLVNLLLRAYQPTSGTLYVGEHELQHIAPHAWLRHVGYVPQDTTVFDGTIRENVRFAEDAHPHDTASEHLVWHALQKAGLDVREQLPNDLDTLVGTKGLRLSGGQRQRLSIAQAIYKLSRREMESAPQLVIADEATSALDSISEAHVLDSLYQALPTETTMVMIAHRLSSLYGCDSILLVRPLDRCGTDHEQVTKHTSLVTLYEQEPLFREMADAQGFHPQAATT
jgi:ABC-type multidrug transport system fused ATPase/permease subunit